MRLAIAIIICTIVLCGCVPLAESYYEPAANGGTPFRDMCHSGPIRDIQFNRGEAKISVYSRFEPHSEHDFSIDLQLGLSHDASGSVSWHEAKVVSPDGSYPPFSIKSYVYNLPFTSFDLPNHRTIASDSIDGNAFSFYEYVIFIHSKLPEKFIYTIPQMIINGISYSSTEVKFTRKSGFWILPLNC